MRVIFEKDTTQEQRWKVVEHYLNKKKYKDKATIQEFKNFFRIYKDEIWNDPKNAHLRRDNKEVIE